ncbi:hypothetical protein FDECE_8739 [Fusarium decemcellulare]|nr:hypothetical protein FDECE_8739 [Fusarium decemcellulare]
MPPPLPGPHGPVAEQDPSSSFAAWVSRYRNDLNDQVEPDMTQTCVDEDYGCVEKELLAGPDKRNNIIVGKYTSLHAAVISGSLGLVQNLINAGLDLDVRDENMNTPLHSAVNLANLDIVKCLLDAGANPELANRYDAVPYDLVCQGLENCAEIMSALTLATAWLNRKPERSRDNRQTDPPSTNFLQLRDAIENRKGETIQKIMTVMRPVDYPQSMVIAALGGHVSVLKWLLERSANPDPAPIRDEDQFLAAPMLIAIGGSNLDIIKMLLNFSHSGRFGSIGTVSGMSYSEIARQRKGPNWEAEVQLLEMAGVRPLMG